MEGGGMWGKWGAYLNWYYSLVESALSGEIADVKSQWVSCWNVGDAKVEVISVTGRVGVGSNVEIELVSRDLHDKIKIPAFEKTVEYDGVYGSRDFRVHATEETKRF